MREEFTHTLASAINLFVPSETTMQRLLLPPVSFHQSACPFVTYEIARFINVNMQIIQHCVALVKCTNKASINLPLWLHVLGLPSKCYHDRLRSLSGSNCRLCNFWMIPIAMLEKVQWSASRCLLNPLK